MVRGSYQRTYQEAKFDKQYRKNEIYMQRDTTHIITKPQEIKWTHSSWHTHRHFCSFNLVFLPSCSDIRKPSSVEEQEKLFIARVFTRAIKQNNTIVTNSSTRHPIWRFVSFTKTKISCHHICFTSLSRSRRDHTLSQNLDQTIWPLTPFIAVHS